MVLESLVTSLLNKYLGMYIEGLDPEQLQMNVWSGNVDLKNLKLKSSCLDQLHLPIKVKLGYVGRLHLSLNWRKLSSEPVQIELEDVYLVSELEKVHTFDEEAERLNAIQDKLLKLRTMEEFALSFGQTKEGQNSEDDGFASALTQKVIDNLQFSIRRIHLRFESPRFRGYRRPMALGFCLQGFEAVTTDSKWNPKFVTGEKMTYKKVELDNLFLYLATSPEDAKPSSEVDIARMADIFSSKTIQYLLRPISGYLRLTTNKQDSPAPKMNIDSLLGTISVSIAEDQYHALLAFISAIGNEQEQIAYELGKIDTKFRKGTEKERREYIALYKRTLNAMWLPELTEVELEAMQVIEAEVIYEDIAKYRAGAIAEISRELGGKRVTLRPKEENEDAGGRWLSSWWGSSSRAVSPLPQSEQPLTLTDEDREAIYKAVSYDSQATKAPVKFAPDFVLTQISFQLKEFGFALCESYSSGGKPLVHLEATNTQVDFRQYPNASVIEAKLQTVALRDDFTPNSLCPDLLSASSPRSNLKSITSLPTTSPSFLEMTYEGNPLNAKGKLDARLKLKLLPHQLVLHGRLLSRISQFFIVSEQLDLRVLSEWSAAQFDQVLKSTSSTLADSLEQYSAMQVELDMEAPTLLLPVDPCKEATDLLVCDLGCIRLKTINQDKDVIRDLTERLSAGDGTTLPQDHQKFYDRFDVQISHVNMFFTDLKNWQTLQEERNQLSASRSSLDSFAGVDFIFRPVDIGLTIFKCAVTGFVSLPNTKVTGKLPLLSIALSSSKYHRLLRLAASFSTPPSAASSSQTASSGQPPLPRARSLTRSTSSSDEAALVEQLATGGTDKDKVSKQAELSLLDLIALLGTEAKAQDVMKKIDMDGDGKVTGKEFNTWWEEQKGQLKSQERLDLSFLLPKIELLISDDSKGAPVLVVRAEITGIDLHVKQRYFDMDVGLHIRAVALLDELTRLGPLIETTAAPTDNSQPQHRRAQSQEWAGDDFFLVKYTSIAKESPDWKNVDSTLSVTAGSVILRVNPDSIKALAVFFVKVFLKDPEAMQAEPSALSADLRARPSSAASPRSPSQGALPDPAGPASNAQREKLRAQFRFGALRVLLLVKQPPAKELAMLSEIAVIGFGTKFIQRTGSMDAEVRLESFAVLDRSPLGRDYPEVICSSTSESALRELVQITYCTFDKRTIQDGNAAAELKIELSGLRIVFLMRYLQEMVQFGTAGPIAELQASLAEGNSQPTPQKEKLGTPELILETKPVQDPGFTQIRLVLSDIDLIIPRRSSSQERMSFALDKVTVANSQQKVDHATVERFSVRINEFSTRSFLLQESKSQEPIEAFLVRMKKFGCNVDKLPQTLSLEVGVEGIDLKLAQRQYQLIMSTLAGNFKEEADMLAPFTTQEKSTVLSEAAEATTSAAASAAASSVFQLKLKLPNIALTLLEDFGVDALDSLVQLELQGIEMELKSAGATFEFNLDMNTLQLKDLSKVGSHITGKEVLPAYRHLIDLKPASGDTPLSPLTLRVQQSLTERKIFLTLDGLLFSMGKVILELPGFFVMPDEPEAESERRLSVSSLVDSDKPEAKKVAVQVDGSGDVKGSDTPSLPLHVELKILNTIMQLVSDPTSRISSALRLTWNLHADINVLPANITQVAAFLPELEVFVSELDSERSDFFTHRHSHKTAERILMPFTAKIFVDTQPSERLQGEQAISVNAKLGDLRSTFTYTSYQLFLACLNALGSRKAAEAAEAEQSPDPLVAAQEQPQDETASVGSFGELRIEVEASSVYVELINNVLGFTTPLAQLVVNRLNLDVLGFQHQRNIDLQVGFAINYFNNQVAGWEPLLEPWHMQVNAYQFKLADLSERRKPVSSTMNLVRIGSNHNMELNLTAAMIKSILDTMNVLTLAHNKMEARLDPMSVRKVSNLKSPNSGGFSGFKPFLLVNQTEFKLHFQAALIDPHSGRTISGRSASVARWDELPFELPKEAASGAVASVAVNLEQEHNWPALELSLSKVGIFQHTLVSVKTGNVKLISELEIVGGVKRISLHSTRGILNETSSALRLECSAQSHSAALNLLPQLIAPGQHLWLPLCAGHESKNPVSLRFTPVDDDMKSHYGLSERLQLTHPFRAPPDYNKHIPLKILHCIPTPSSRIPNFSLSIGLERSQLYSLLILRPPFVVKNGLVCPVKVRACGTAGSRVASSDAPTLDIVEEKLLDCNHLAEVHAVAETSLRSLSLAIQFPEAPAGWSMLGGWSQIAELSLESPIAISKQFITPCAQGEIRLRVNVKAHWENCQLHVFLLVPFWLTDISNEKLKIVAENQSSKEAFQIQAGDSERRQVVMYNVPEQANTETRVCIMTKQGWSDFFPFRVGISSLAGPQNQELSIGYQTQLAGAAFPGTKVINFAPKYILVNRLSVPVLVAQLQTNEQQTLTDVHPETLLIPARDQVCYFWPMPHVPSERRALVVRRSGKEYDEWQWSGTFSPDKVCQRELMIRHRSQPNLVWFCRIETRVRGPTLFTVITPHPDSPSVELNNLLPFRIDNRSVREQLQFRQVLNPQVRLPQSEYRWLDVGLRSTVPFALEETDQPARIKIRVGFRGHNVKGEPRYERTFELDLEELDTAVQSRIPLAKAPPHAIPSPQGSALFVLMETEGPVRVLVFSDFADPGRNVSVQGEAGSEKRPVDLRRQLHERLNFQDAVIKDIDLMEKHRHKIGSRIQTVADAKIARPSDVPDHVGQLRVDVIEGKNMPPKSYVVVRFEGGSLERKSGILDAQNPKWLLKCRFVVPPVDVMGSTVLHVEVWQNGLWQDSILGQLQWHLSDLSTYQPNTSWFNLRTDDPRAGSIQVALWWITPSLQYLQEQILGIEKTIREKREILQKLQDDARVLFTEVEEEEELQRKAVEGQLTPLECSDAFRNAPGSRIELSIYSVVGIESLLPQTASVRQGFKYFKFRFTRTRFTGYSLQLEQLLLLSGRDNMRPNTVICVKGRSPSGEGVENLTSNEPNKFLDQNFSANGSSIIIYEYKQPIFATEALLKTANDIPERDPVDFTVEASFDQDVWYLLAKVDNAKVPRDRRAYYPAVLLNPYPVLPGRLECIVRFPLMQQEAAVVLWKGKLDLNNQDNPPTAIFFVPDELLDKRSREECQLLLTFLYREPSSNQAIVPFQTVATLSLPLKDMPINADSESVIERSLDHSGLRSGKFVRVKMEGAGPGPRSVVLFLGRFRARSFNFQPILSTELALRHAGLSIVTETPEELLYFHLSRLVLTYEESSAAQSFNITLGHMQLDNQELNPTYRVVMAPAPVIQELWQPFIQVIVVKAKESRVPVQVFEYVTILLQCIELKIEEQLIYKIVNLANHLLSETKTTELLVPKSVSLQELLSPPAEEHELYFESLHLQPISAKISFEAKPGMRGQMEGASYNPLQVLLSVVGTALGNVDEYPLRLTGHLVTNVRGDASTIVPALQQRYVTDLIGQLHKIVGSMEVLGNPVGLINNLGSGVHDAFYEPYKGLVKSPKDFALGVRKGGKSLLLSFSGLAGSFSKISRAIGKGAAVLSMDEKFLARQEQKAKPKNVSDGFVSGVKSLGTGVVSGVFGVITSPLEGAQRDGALGFAKGVGLGMTGLVVKPVSGLLTAVGQTFEGVESSAKAALNTRLENAPYRRPRQFSKERTLVLQTDRP
eukprot:g79679.t1